MNNKQVHITVIENFICDKHLLISENVGKYEKSITAAIEEFEEEVKNSFKATWNELCFGSANPSSGRGLVHGKI